MKISTKFFLGFLAYSLAISVTLVLLISWWGVYQFQKPGPLSEETLYTVERGQGTRRIANDLYDKGYIDNPYIFMIGTTLLGHHTDLKAGEYELEPAMSMKNIMDKLREGKTLVRRFTIREGLTSYEIIKHLSTVNNLSGEIEVTPPEGSLLPNTYDYSLDEPREKIIERLEKEMQSALIDICKIEIKEEPSLKKLLEHPCGNEPLKTVNDVLTLASLIEKETGKAEERERISGVFINRLRMNMPLQTDPTVIYAITGGKHKNDGKGPLGRRLLRKDLQIDNPYNTYKYPGLPPGPIANPGRASIEAAVNPEKNDFLYFVADGTGGHAFSKTLKEHNENARKWRKIRQETTQ